MQHLFVFALIIYSSQSWVLKTTHKEVTPQITQNVTLECIYDNKDNGQSRIAAVLGILIHIFHGSDDWDTYAKVFNTYQNAVLGDDMGPGVTVKGHVGKIQESFLSVTWSVSSSNTTGKYACEINGYAEDDTLIKVITDSVSIVESQLSLLFLQSLFLNQREQTQKTLSQSSEIIGRMLKSLKRIHEDLDTLKEDVNATKEMVNNISNATGEITKEDVKSIVLSKLHEWDGGRNWPRGEYAVLNTNTGCPSSLRWTAGYVKFHSESSKGNNDDKVSRPSNLAKPVFETAGTNKFFYISTCKRLGNIQGPAWPKGSYCIHRVGGSCPMGFVKANIQLDPEDSPHLGPDYRDAPDVQMDASNQYQTFSFCCRHDQAPSTPIYLPVNMPFYLYRYKGVCQRVYDTKVSDEWFQIDTEDGGNGDRNLTEAHPDFTLNPARFFLCYYTSNY